MTQEPPNSSVLSLPPWAAQMRENYLAGVASQFLLHSNTRDLIPFKGQFLPLREFVIRALSWEKNVVVFYNISEGITFADETMRDRFFRVMDVKRSIENRPKLDRALPADPARVLPLLEELMSVENRVMVVIDYADTIVPAGDMSFMSPSDRTNLVTLQRWASDPQILARDCVVLLIAGHLSEVHPRLRAGTSRLQTVEIPFPDYDQRLVFIRHRMETGQAKVEMTPEQVAANTAGLNLVQIDSVFRLSEKTGRPVDFELIRREKKEIIESECAGIVEFVEPKHGMDLVGGLDTAKQVFMRVAQAIKEGERKRVPMGILCVGPPGTGKTFLAEAFAHDCGLNCLKLGSFREKWVGATEANLEKILSIIKALAPVIVILDEMDQSVGQRQSEGDSGTSNRVFAMIISFMGDTDHRGRILWIGCTNRPDLLDAAMKRPGRFDLRAPFFSPTAEGRKQIFEAMFRKNEIQQDLASLDFAVQATEGWSGAEIEAVVLKANEFAQDAGRQKVTEEDLRAALADFIPTRDETMIEYMELLSVRECSSKRLLPDRFKDMSAEQVTQRIRELEILVGPQGF
jgi:AAA+ superfamily predicted ATPase